jgi:glycoprotein endo-alpha-1,2-mannosidase
LLSSYDSYHISNVEWAQLLAPQGRMSVRGTPYDGVFIALWLSAYDGRDIVHGGFDGAYTYFASGEGGQAAGEGGGGAVLAFFR